MLRSILGMPKRIVNAKIACLDFSLQKTKMKLGVQVVITDPEKLDQIRQRYVERVIFDLVKGVFVNYPFLEQNDSKLKSLMGSRV